MALSVIRVDFAWDHLDQLVQECNRSGRLGLLKEPRERDLRGAVDGDEEVELAFLSAHLGDVMWKKSIG
jgi:hypothetical protein